jgi:hypothetical protein
MVSKWKESKWTHHIKDRTILHTRIRASLHKNSAYIVQKHEKFSHVERVNCWNDMIPKDVASSESDYRVHLLSTHKLTLQRAQGLWRSKTLTMEVRSKVNLSRSTRRLAGSPLQSIREVSNHSLNNPSVNKWQMVCLPCCIDNNAAFKVMIIEEKRK